MLAWCALDTSALEVSNQIVVD